MLLEFGADVNAKDNNENTRLHLAIQEVSSPKILNMLLKKEADINTCNSTWIDPTDELYYKIRRSSSKQNELQNNLNEFNECFIRDTKNNTIKITGTIFSSVVRYT